MDIAALVLWVVTALGGLTMAGIWMAHHGPAQHAAGVSRISPGRLGAHIGLAVVGLVVWIVYIAPTTRRLAGSRSPCSPSLASSACSC